MNNLRKVTYKRENDDKIQRGLFHKWVVAKDQVFGIIEVKGGRVQQVPLGLIRFSSSSSFIDQHITIQPFK